MTVLACANAVRMLSVDAVEKAQSGHPGMPLGMADIATVLWQKFIKHNPKNPHWFNRDRFILSNGHGSMLLYSILHLTGYALSIDDLKHFRQLHSKTPGHPEYNETPGVETSTGPLAQGLANAVGMAIAERILAHSFNREFAELVNHFTYVFVGDGCLMEGLSHEVCSLAGTLKLGKLIVFYDDNGISIDGKVENWFTDDTAMRFRSYDWHVIEAIDGHDYSAIEEAIDLARKQEDKPTLIICKTTIGFASQVAGSEKSHGAPLGADGVAYVREQLNWPYAPFVIPDAIYTKWNHFERGEREENAWLSVCETYQQKDACTYHEFLRRINGDLPEDFIRLCKTFVHQCAIDKKALSTRKASQHCLNYLAPFLPEMLGGSADLTGSNNTNSTLSKAVKAPYYDGNYMFYGVREFGMASIMNGIALHGGFIPYGGTFLVFSDYARNAIRLSALMMQRVIYVFTHDSIGLGEDGPTHQPIEHAHQLRMTPNVHVWRPACLVETAVAWEQALLRHTGPSALLLSRQDLPPLIRAVEAYNNIHKGGYILYENNKDPDIIVLATGSEVQLALEAAQKAALLGKNIRVVSMPCVEQFLLQDKDYQEYVLPKAVRKRVAIEAAATQYWYRFVGLDGVVIGLDSFGLSAIASDLFEYFGITVERVTMAINAF